MRKFLVSLSSVNLERFQSRNWEDLARDPDWRQRARFLERLDALIERLPPLEQDVIHLYFRVGKKQEVISKLLGISQQAVSHRMYSAFRRITFMLGQPEVANDQMREDLVALLPKKNVFAVNVLCDFAITSNQTATARNLGVPQQKVCWHLNAALRYMRKQQTVDALFYVEFFERLLSHRSILREIAGRTDGGRAQAVDAGSSARSVAA